jgi:hypothetical protein
VAALTKNDINWLKLSKTMSSDLLVALVDGMENRNKHFENHLRHLINVYGSNLNFLDNPQFRAEVRRAILEVAPQMSHNEVTVQMHTFMRKMFRLISKISEENEGNV